MSQEFSSGTPISGGACADGEAIRETRSTAYYFTAVVILVLLVEITGLTYTMVTPALPEIAAVYRTPDVAWAVTAVTLVGAIAFAVFGKLGDVFGKKRVALGCAVVFAGGSILSALAPSFGVLVAGRALQGVGLATLTLVYGLIRDILPKKMIPVALGFIGTGMGASTILGPFIGGLLIEGFGFRGIFWFHVAYTSAACLLVFLFVPESNLRTRTRLDWPGATLLGLGALLLLTGIGNAGKLGWLSPITLGGIAMGLAVLAGWIGYERRAAEPLVDVNLLRQRRVGLTLVAAFFVQFALVGNSMLIPLFVMNPASTGYGFGASSLEVAKFIAAAGLAAMIAGPLAGLLARRSSPRDTLLLGTAAIVVGSVGLAFGHGTETGVILAQLVFGIGIGTCTASLPNLVVQAVPANVQGVSGGMLNLTGSLGSSVGSQLLVAMLLIPAVTYLGGRVVYGESGFVIAFLVTGSAGALAMASAFAIDSLARPDPAAVSAVASQR